jgi:hypothetical protein
MPTPTKCEQRFLGAFMGVALKRGVVYQVDIAGATWTATWTGERDLEGTPIFAQLEDRCARVPSGRDVVRTLERGRGCRRLRNW